MTQANPRALRESAKSALTSAIDASLSGYNRRLALSSLPSLSAETILSETEDAAKRVVQEIEGALRRERARAGHWTYDLNRHIALHVAHRAETARLEQLRARDASARAFQTLALCINSPK